MKLAAGRKRVRVASSAHLPPAPDRFKAIKPTKMERVWLVFACVNCILVAFFVCQRVELHFLQRAIAGQGPPDWYPWTEIPVRPESLLPSAEKDRLDGGMTSCEVGEILGNPHGTWGSGIVRQVWFFDDGTFLRGFNNHLAWGRGGPDTFTSGDAWGWDEGIFLRCAKGDAPQAGLPPEGGERAVRPGMSRGEVEDRLGSFRSVSVSESDACRLWTFADGLYFAGHFNPYGKLWKGQWFSCAGLEETVDWDRFLDTGIWLPLEALPAGNAARP